MREALVGIILEAGELFKSGYYATKEITHKGKKDLVTQYDVAVEKFLIEKFSHAFKGFNVIAEESDNNAKIFGNSIIVDPIDGTTNFVNKVPHCSISVGVYKDKKPLIGVVYNPILNELYIGETGKGATKNGKPIAVSDESELIKSLIATGFPYTSGSNPSDLEDVMRRLNRILPECQDIRRLGSASLDLCMVAEGVFEGYYEMNLKPWDVAAGIIILSEAGGVFTGLEGGEYDLFADKYIVATNGKIQHLLLERLR